MKMPSEPMPHHHATENTTDSTVDEATERAVGSTIERDDTATVAGSENAPIPRDADRSDWGATEGVEMATALRVAVMRLRRKLNYQRAQDHYLTANQLSVMGTLKLHGAMTIGELALHEKVRPPSMTRTITSMEELRLVAREPHPSDRRLVVVRLLPAGEGIIRDDRKHRDAWLASRLSTLTPEELTTLRQAAPILERLAAS